MTDTAAEQARQALIDWGSQHGRWRKREEAIAAIDHLEQQVQELQRELAEARKDKLVVEIDLATEVEFHKLHAERAEATNTRLRSVIPGLLQGGMSAAWEWAVAQHGWWYVTDLMAVLGVTPTHANNYARELTEKGLLDRERSDPGRGGKQFRYRAALAQDAEQETA